MKPLLSADRFDTLMQLVLPPLCECKWIEVANERFFLTKLQKQKLKEAKDKASRFMAMDFYKHTECNKPTTWIGKWKRD